MPPKELAETDLSGLGQSLDILRLENKEKKAIFGKKKKFQKRFVIEDKNICFCFTISISIL